MTRSSSSTHQAKTPSSKGHGLMRWIRRCNQKNLDNFVPFFWENQALGWIPVQCLSWFRELPEVFETENMKVSLHSRLQTQEARTDALAEVLEDWKDKGRVPGWRDELYRVSISFDAEPVFFWNVRPPPCSVSAAMVSISTALQEIPNDRGFGLQDVLRTVPNTQVISITWWPVVLPQVCKHTR